MRRGLGKARMTEKKKARLHVCFYRRWAYGLFDPASPTVFGGAEVRSWQFAQELARRPGFRVSFMVGDEGQPAQQSFGNIMVLREKPAPLHKLLTELVQSAYDGYRTCGEPSPRFPWFRLRRFGPGLL